VPPFSHLSGAPFYFGHSQTRNSFSDVLPTPAPRCHDGVLIDPILSLMLASTLNTDVGAPKSLSQNVPSMRYRIWNCASPRRYPFSSNNLPIFVKTSVRVREGESFIEIAAGCQSQGEDEMIWRSRGLSARLAMAVVMRP